MNSSSCSPHAEDTKSRREVNEKIQAEILNKSSLIPLVRLNDVNSIALGARSNLLFISLITASSLARDCHRAS